MIRSCSTADRSNYIPAFFPEPTQSGPFGRWLWRYDGRTGKRLSSIHWLASRAIHVLWFGLLWAPLVRGIARECHSLPRRIGTIYATKIYRHGVRLGSLGGCKDQSSDMRTLACTRDMQRITNCRPWATPLDLAAYVEAWSMGAEWAAPANGIHLRDKSDTVLQAQHAPELASVTSCSTMTPVT
jgi:hypothetical protein